MNTLSRNSYGGLHLHGRQKKNNGTPQQCRRWKKSPMILSKRRGILTSSGIKQGIMRRKTKKIKGCIRQLKAEMEEISKEQEA
ncbi:hypothetical protein SLEP1_g49114 [Rubroshorea leprosula]|uniref:Uncharacterized protein n=1 Tax=Rubroshorea leprosula TaxID=152421 RepID=A0AAV5LWR3_9ROSI|nr:hypothetical protein SLEP1_g49114 [Rubroshorea leprosula]